MKSPVIALATLLAGSLCVSGAVAAVQYGPRVPTRPAPTREIHVRRGTNPVVYFKVVPHVYDPGLLFEAQAEWEEGLGCFNDPGCPDGDSFDHNHWGLLLAKSGLTQDNVAGFATTTVAHGSAPLEFGYDIRNGSHCGAGAPRFNVVTNDGVTHFIGCASPPPTSTIVGVGWTRMRWGDEANGVPPPAFPSFLPGNTINSVQIVFDEGTDIGTGEAIIDNVEVDGVEVGRPPCSTHFPC